MSIDEKVSLVLGTAAARSCAAVRILASSSTIKNTHPNPSHKRGGGEGKREGERAGTTRKRAGQEGGEGWGDSSVTASDDDGTQKSGGDKGRKASGI